MKDIARQIYWFFRRRFPIRYYFCFLHDPFKTRFNIIRYSVRKDRMLEIGSSGGRLAGFENLSITGGPRIDYVLDTSTRLPFADSTFNVIYASHVLEHIPWFQTEIVLKEWWR